MHAFSSEHVRSLLTGHSVVRLLIVSYFIALAFGVIDGTNVAALARPFMPDGVAGFLTSAMLLVLSGMILIGWYRRGAALVLALAMFWASYMAMMAAPDAQLGAFWRDLALIGALVLSYSDTKASRTGHGFVNADDTTMRRKSRISQAIETTRTVISRPSARSVSLAKSEQAELYRKDLDIVRTS